MQTSAGRSIYEDDTAMFVSQEQADYYRDETAGDAARTKLHWVQQHIAGGQLLDVGANVGYFAREASAVFRTIGIEPGRRTVEWGRAHLGAPLEIGSIDEDRRDFHGRFDAVTLFDVIEHVPRPANVVARCREYLATGGSLFITTPDAGSVMARLLGRQWYYIDLVEHISLFTRDNLRKLLNSAGFTVVDTRTIGRRYKYSYIERRLRQLARDTALLRAAHAMSLPLTLAPGMSLSLNLGDVMGMVATVRDV